MALAYICVALLTGLSASFVVMIIGGSWPMALLAYVLSGQIALAAACTHKMLRQPHR